jgi:predicted GIY-YIG superfamily endonuclease
LERGFMGIIYALSEELDGETFYIGKATDLERRHNQHLNFKGGTHAGNIWINYCLRIGNPATIRILEECHDSILAIREKGWIQFGFSQGWNLANTVWSPSPVMRMFIAKYTRAKIYGDKTPSNYRDMDSWWGKR